MAPLLLGVEARTSSFDDLGTASRAPRPRPARSGPCAPRARARTSPARSRPARCGQARRPALRQAEHVHRVRSPCGRRRRCGASSPSAGAAPARSRRACRAPAAGGTRRPGSCRSAPSTSAYARSKPRMPKSIDASRLGRRGAIGQAPHHLDAEPVVAEEDVADAGDEHGRRSRLAACGGHAAARPRRPRRRSGGPAGAAGRGRGRVVVDDHGQVDSALEVLLDRLDRGDLARRAPGRRCRRRRAAAAAPGRPAAARRPPIAQRRRAGGGPRARRTPIRSWRSSSAVARTAHRRRAAASSARAQRLGALEQLPRARVGAPHLVLLLVGQRQDAQREDLVDLGAVEEVAGALGATCG